MKSEMGGKRERRMERGGERRQSGWRKEEEEGQMGNEMMRESDEVKALEEDSYDFNTMKDNPSNSDVY